MQHRLMLATLAAGALGLAGCGASSGASSPAQSAASSPPTRIFHLTMSGKAETPTGAPTGTGDAIIAIHGTSTVCWRFAHLHGFTQATFAHIHLGAPGTAGKVVVPLSTGPALHHRGCVAVSPTLIKAIERTPSAYYVNVHSVKYPGGAVRAQL